MPDEIITVNWHKTMGWRSWRLLRWELSRVPNAQRRGLRFQTIRLQQLSRVPVTPRHRPNAFLKKIQVMARITQKTPGMPLKWSDLAVALGLIQLMRSEFWRDGFIPLRSFSWTHSYFPHLPTRTAALLDWIDSFGNCNEHEFSPTAWPGDYFPQQALDANFIKENPRKGAAVTANL